MKVVIIDSASEAHNLQGFDLIVPLSPANTTDPRVVSIQPTPETSLLQDILLFDQWATEVANCILTEEHPLTPAEREAFRNWLLSNTMSEMLGIWSPLTSFLEDRIRRGDEIEFRSTRPLLRIAVQHRFDSQQMQFRPEGSKENASPRVRIGRAASKVMKLVGMPGVILTLNQMQRIKRPLIMIYLVSSVCYKIIGRMAALLNASGFNLLLVDLSLSSNTWNQTLPFPLVRCQSIVLPRHPETRSIQLGPHRNGSINPMLMNEQGDLIQLLTQRAAPAIDRQVRMHQWLWSRLNPKAVVICEEGLSAACLALAATRANIPSICVAHFCTTVDHRAYGFSAVALYGPKIVENHSQHENPPPTCRLEPVGACRFDEIFRAEYPDSASIRQQLRVASDTLLVCFASQWTLGSDHRGLKNQALIWLMEALPRNAVLVVKKHPLESEFTCDTTLSNYDSTRYRITRDIDLYGLLATSSVLVTLWSTTSIEAVLLRKPVIIIDNPEANNEIVTSYELAIRAKDVNDLGRALNQCAEKGSEAIPHFDQNRRRLIQDYLVSDDGRSSERLVDLIRELSRQ